MELVMRLPRGRRARTASQPPNPPATTSAPTPINSGCCQPEFGDANSLEVATAFVPRAAGGLAATTGATGGLVATTGTAVVTGGAEVISDTGSGGGKFVAGIGFGGAGTTTFGGGAEVDGLGSGALTAGDGGFTTAGISVIFVEVLVPTMISAGTGAGAGAGGGGLAALAATGGGSGFGGGGNFGKFSGNDRFTEQPRYSPRYARKTKMNGACALLLRAAALVMIFFTPAS